MTPAAEVLDVIKTRLGCLYNTEAEDSRLGIIIEDSIAELCRIAGTDDIDFTAPGLPRALLVNMVWYGLNDAGDDFPTRYLSDLVTFRNEFRTPENDGPENGGP